MKRPVGRPRKDHPLTEQVSLSVTREEHDALKQRAAERGCSLGHYLRDRLELGGLVIREAAVKKTPRPLSIVKYTGKDLFANKVWSAMLSKNPEFGEHWLFLGEVSNMPGHAAVTSLLTGNTVTLHTENLKEVEEEET